MTAFASVDSLLGGSLTTTIEVWLPNIAKPQRICVPAIGGSAFVLRPGGDPGTLADQVPVFGAADGSGAPLAQPLEADEDGSFVGWVVQAAVDVVVQASNIAQKRIVVGAPGQLAVIGTSGVPSPSALFVTAAANEASSDPSSWWTGGTPGTYVMLIKWTPLRSGRVPITLGPPQAGLPSGTFISGMIWAGQRENIDYPALDYTGSSPFPTVNDINGNPSFLALGVPSSFDLVSGQPYTIAITVGLAAPANGVDFTATVLPVLQSLQSFGPVIPEVPWPDGSVAVAGGGGLVVPPDDPEVMFAVYLTIHASTGGSLVGPQLVSGGILLDSRARVLAPPALVLTYQDVLTPGSHVGLHYEVVSGVKGKLIAGIAPEVLALGPFWSEVSFQVVRTDGSAVYTVSNVPGFSARPVLDNNAGGTYNATFLDWATPAALTGSDLSNPGGTNYVQSAEGGPLTVTLLAGVGLGDPGPTP